MKQFLKSLSLVFAAGCFGALVSSIQVFLFGHFGVTEHFGVKMAPEFVPMWLYPRIVWGGIWGAILLIPTWRNLPWLRILIFSIGPTIDQLFWVFPFKLAKGFLDFSSVYSRLGSWPFQTSCGPFSLKSGFGLLLVNGKQARIVMANPQIYF